MTLVRPVTRPALVIRLRPWLRAQPVQMLFSFLRESVREMLMPHVSLFGLKFSVRNGISTSKLHAGRGALHALVPDAVPLAVLAVDARAARRPSRRTGWSRRNTRVRPSRNVSIVHCTLSSCCSASSRRF